MDASKLCSQSDDKQAVAGNGLGILEPNLLELAGRVLTNMKVMVELHMCRQTASVTLLVLPTSVRHGVSRLNLNTSQGTLMAATVTPKCSHIRLRANLNGERHRKRPEQDLP